MDVLGFAALAVGGFGRLRAAPRLKISIRNSISRADVAQFVVTELERGTHLRTAPTLTAS